MSPTDHHEILEEICQAVRSDGCVLPHGARTKAALSIPSEFNAQPLDMTRLSGIVDYQAEEFTLTALAGTPVAEACRVLAQNGQYLPFDPPLTQAGATLGGTIAAGASGSGRYRYGGVRDFLIGVRFIDGRGRLIRGGGQVVKNAAGFDLPKLLVGSLGRLGILVELTFKVFPAPLSRQTLRIAYEDLEAALRALVLLGYEDWGFEAIDLEPPNILWLRLAGASEAVEAQCQMIDRASRRVVEIWRQPHAETVPDLPITDGEDPWTPWNECEIDPSLAWVKVPLIPSQIPALDHHLGRVSRRYIGGGQCAWIHWPSEDLDALDSLLRAQKLQGLTLTPAETRWTLGAPLGNTFLDRIRSALDPDQKFLPYTHKYPAGENRAAPHSNR